MLVLCSSGRAGRASPKRGTARLRTLRKRGCVARRERRSCRRTFMADEAVTSSGPRLHQPLIEKLKRYADLGTEEIEPLALLLSRERHVPRDREIVVQGRPYHALYVLNDGLALRYKILADGKRQVL